MDKALYAAGLQCERRLWQLRHAPERAAAPQAGEQERRAESLEVRLGARSCCPGGVAVDEADQSAAQARTRQLLANPSVPAIFGAAFEHEGVQVRADLLERLPDGRFGLCEVKSAGSARPEHLDDLALQLWVLRGAGLALGSVELWLVDATRRAGPGELDWSQYFVRRDVFEEARFLAEDVADRLAEQRGWLAGAEPERAPSPHCRAPRACEFIGHCTAGLPDDWIGRLPGLRSAEYEALRECGVTTIGAIPDSFPLKPRQARARQAQRGGGQFVAPGLARALAGSGPPAAYLDFEATSAARPIFPGTTPFQQVPFQWSLHRVDACGALSHAEFLAPAKGDPRRPFAESLVAELSREDLPIHVYSSYEARMLDSLASDLPDLAAGLAALVARLVDLLEVVRDHVYANGFAGSYSIKRVAPVLVPGFGYDDLDGIADGARAAVAIGALLRGALDPEAEARVRAELRAYCARDTLALVELHRALRALAERR